MKKFSLTAVSLFALFSQTAQADTLWLNITGSPNNADSVQVVDMKKGEFRVTPVQTKQTMMNQKGWDVVALDKKGKEIYRTFVKDTRHARFEAFSPETGEIEQIKEVFIPEINTNVILPYDNELSQLKITTIDGTETVKKSKKTKKGKELILSRDMIEKSVAKPAVKTFTNHIHSETVSAASRAVKRPLTVAVIGDGYTASEMSKWKTDAKKVVDGFVADPLINKLKDRFEFIRIDLPSQDSGITIFNQVTKNTALKSILGCSNIDRLLCTDVNRAHSAAREALGYGNYDQILVVANTTHYGGAGYTGVGTLTMNSASTELALHEFGHSAYHLADEYDYGDCYIDDETSQANLTKETDRNKIKWRHLIDPNTPIPTTHNHNGVVGLFEGADYCAKGKYRPTYNSKMRTLYSNWDAVNEEHIYKVMDGFGSAGESEQANDQKFLDALNLQVSSKEKGDHVQFDATLNSNTKPVSTPSYTWSLPAGANGSNSGKSEQSFSIMRTDKNQTVILSVEVKTGKTSRIIQKSILIPSKKSFTLPIVNDVNIESKVIAEALKNYDSVDINLGNSAWVSKIYIPEAVGVNKQIKIKSTATWNTGVNYRGIEEVINSSTASLNFQSFLEWKMTNHKSLQAVPKEKRVSLPVVNDVNIEAKVIAEALEKYDVVEINIVNGAWVSKIYIPEAVKAGKFIVITTSATFTTGVNYGGAEFVINSDAKLSFESLSEWKVSAQ